jgi:hypothetical protein
MRDHEYPSGHKTPKERQQKVLAAVNDAGLVGLTPREFAKRMTPGDVSAVNGWGGAFTVLRQEKFIVALDERREDHHVYVMEENVAGRKTWPGYRHKGTVIIVKHCATCTCGGSDD